MFATWETTLFWGSLFAMFVVSPVLLVLSLVYFIARISNRFGWIALIAAVGVAIPGALFLFAPVDKLNEIHDAVIEQTLRDDDAAIAMLLRAIGTDRTREIDCSLFDRAAGENCRKVVSAYLARGQEPGADAIVGAACHADGLLLRAMFEHGGDPEAVWGYNPITPLMAAVNQGMVDNVVYLLGLGANANDADGNGKTALHMAVASADPDATRLLLDAGADLKRQDKHGYTPLHQAALTNDPACARILLASGADLDVLDLHGFPPLYRALEYKYRRPMAEVLLPGITAMLAHPEAVTSADATHPLLLHAAAIADSATLVQRLVDLGFDVKARDAAGSTPLHLAAFCEASTETVELLIHLGANVNARDMWGNTPLHHAASRVRSFRSVRVLRLHGADMSIANSTGKRPISLATEGDTRRVLIASPELLADEAYWAQ